MEPNACFHLICVWSIALFEQTNLGYENDALLSKNGETDPFPFRVVMVTNIF